MRAMSNRKTAPLLIAVTLGALLWVLASAFSGRREPWDSGGYWAIAYPAAIFAAGVVGYFFPERPWRWALALFGAQFVTMCVINGELGNLWPLGLALFAILALPAVFVATIASRMSSRSRPDEVS